MKKDKQITDIARDINNIIQRNVYSMTANDAGYKSKIEEAIQEIKAEIEHSEQMIEAYEETLYSAGRIEEEGHLRGLKDAFDIIVDFYNGDK